MAFKPGKPAKPQGKKPVDKLKPNPNKTSNTRQSSGPSLPTARPPGGGGTTPQTGFGAHLQ